MLVVRVNGSGRIGLTESNTIEERIEATPDSFIN